MESILFSPIQMRQLTLKNRVVVSPMCQYSSVDGFASDWHLVHLGGRALGGAGLVFTEATAVEPEGRISPGDLGLWKDAHVENLARVVRFIVQQGASAGIQLAHAGRKASVAPPWSGGKRVGPNEEGWTPVAPSPLPFDEEDAPPQPLDEAGITRVVHAFAQAAARAKAAGFQVAEVHAAHGYLLHEFLSPLTNRRTDRYGGSFDNRTRLVREVVQAVRKQWPEQFPLFVRLSVTDWLDGGWTVEDSIALSRLLAKDGVDLIDCSSGGIARGARIPTGAGYQTGFAERLRREAGIPTGAVGMIRSAYQAEHVLRTQQADLVLLARALLRDPHWPLRAARKLGVTVPWPVQYERAGD